MAKLWQKDYQLDSLIEEFTVGIDYILDQRLVPADCAASAAHAVMLSEAGILSVEDKDALLEGLRKALKTWQDGSFEIKRSDEDGHTALEGFLVETCGEAGKKIHTGRSRNDQVITAVRVYARSFLLKVLKEGSSLVQRLLAFAETHKNVPMPGRTHTQIAMPSSVGLWAAAYGEQLLDDLQLLEGVFQVINQWPLGAAAGYGVPLPLKRDRAAELMGFDRVQNNVIYVGNSRGKTEAMILDAFDQTGITLSKMAQDLILYSLPEMGYFSLPDQLCTGSSIMPQKKNPDGLELMRGKTASLSGWASQIKNIIRSAISGYNRDSQEVKEPFLKGCDTILLCMRVMDLTFKDLVVNGDNLRKAFTPEIYATDVALELVAGGMSFRDAYKEIGLNLDKLSSRTPDEFITNRTYPGTAGNLNLTPAVDRAEALGKSAVAREEKISELLKELLGTDVSVLG